MLRTTDSVAEHNPPAFHHISLRFRNTTFHGTVFPPVVSADRLGRGHGWPGRCWRRFEHVQLLPTVGRGAIPPQHIELLKDVRWAAGRLGAPGPLWRPPPHWSARVPPAGGRAPSGARPTSSPLPRAAHGAARTGGTHRQQPACWRRGNVLFTKGLPTKNVKRTPVFIFRFGGHF